MDETGQEKRLTNAIHGNIYQLKVLMLFLYRGVSNRYSFRLGTEIEQAHKFDDLVFEYSHNGRKVYRLLQAKHRLDESKKITVRQLLNENKGDYSLIKYFFSYQHTKNEQLFRDGTIRDVTICTNIDFDFDDLQLSGIIAEKIIERDDILDLVSDKKQPSRYKISQSVVLLLKPKLLEIGQYKATKGCLDDEIKDFLNHLVFAVNQPNEEELGDIVKKEIGKEFDCLTTEMVYNKFLVKMLNWLQGRGDGVFLSYEEGKRFFEEARKGIPIWFGLRDPVESFVGRNKQLEELHDLMHCAGDTNVSKTILVTGLGGVGKSELAKKYAKTYSSLHDDKVIWINSETYQSLVDCFHRLACDVLRISTKNANGEEKEISSIVEDVYRFFSKGKSLFIFDNAERFKTLKDYDQGLDKFLPALPTECKKPHLLITSRNQKWPKNMKALQLEGFCKEEAAEFICKSLNLKGSCEKNYVDKLANELQFFPLALQQAVAYVQVQDEKLKNVGSYFKVKDYLKRFSERAKDLLDFEFPEDSDNDYTKTMMTTWVITFDEIAQKYSGPDALKIVDILAYVSADNIPIELFSELVGDAEKLGSAVELLKQYSIITNVKNGKLNVHRLLQKIVRIQMKEQDREKDILTAALALFRKGAVNLENVDHALSVWNYSCNYSDVITEFYDVSFSISEVLLKDFRWEEAYSFSLMVKETFLFMLSKLEATPTKRENQSTEEKAFKNKIVGILVDTTAQIARALIKLGKYRIALSNFLVAHTFTVQLLGPGAIETLYIKFDIADALQELGKYGEALECYEEAFCGLRLKLGDDHKDTLAAKSGIAEVNYAKGNFEGSLKMYREIQVIQEATFGKYDTGTMLTAERIAGILRDMDNHEEALKILEEIRDYRERTLGNNHPDTLKTKVSIASLGRGDTLKQLNDILAAQKSLYGENHTIVLKTLETIGIEISKQCKYDEALKIFQEVLNKKIEIFGPSHRETLTTQQNLGLTLADQGKHEEALTIFQDVLTTLRKVLGDEHPDTAITMMLVAEELAKLGKFKQAFEYFKEMKQHSATETHRKLDRQFNVGGVFFNQGKYDQAFEILQDVYDKQQKIVKPNDQNLLVTQHHIGMTLEGKGQYKEALQVYEAELRQARLILGNEHDKTLIAGLSIALMGLKVGQLGKAVPLIKQIIEIGRRSSEKCCSQEIISRLIFTAGEFYDQDKYNEALQIYQFVIEKKKLTVDEYDPELLETQISLAASLIELCSFNEVLFILNELLPKLYAKFGQNHILTMRVTKMIATTYTKTSQFDKALEPYEELLKYEKSTLGENHYDTINSEHNLGLIHYEMRNHEQALALLRNVLKKLRSFYPTDTLITNTKFCIEMITRDKEKYCKSTKGYLKSTTFQNIQHFYPNNAKARSDSTTDDLLTVVNDGNREKLDKLLKQGGDVNSKDQNNRTLLHHAVDIGCIDIVELLLEYGADVTRVTVKGNTPLHIATARGYKDIVELLLKYQRPETLNDFVDAKTNGGGTTSLHVAAERGHFDIVVILLRHGGVYDTRNKNGKMPLDLATDDIVVQFLHLVAEMFENAAKGHASMISKLEKLDHHQKMAMMNARNYQRMSLNQIALTNNHKKLASRLSKLVHNHAECKPPNEECVKPGLTTEDILPIVKDKNTRELEKLLKRGGDVNSKDQNKRTLLHHAVDIGCIDIVELLLEHGADVTRVTVKGNTPLHIATARGYKDIVELLLKYQRPETLNDFVDAKTYGGGTTSLHVAAERGHFDIVVSLLRHGGAYDSRNTKGKTPLDLATDETVVQFLHLVAEMFEYAAKGHASMISKLEKLDHHQKMAMMNATNYQRMTLNQIALTNNHKKFASRLSKLVHNHAKCKPPNEECVKPGLTTEDILPVVNDKNTSTRKLEKLLKESEDVSSKDQTNRTLLHHAADNTSTDQKEKSLMPSHRNEDISKCEVVDSMKPKSKKKKKKRKNV